MESKKIEVPGNVRFLQFNYEVGEVEFYRMQLGFILPKLNNTMLTMLAYVKVYGEKAKDKLIADGIITSNNTFYTYKCALNKEGYLIDYKVNEGIKLMEFSEEPVLVFNYIKTNSSKNEVEYKYYRASH